MGVVSDMVTSSEAIGSNEGAWFKENYPEAIFLLCIGFILGICFTFLVKGIYRYIKSPKIRKEITVKKDTEKEWNSLLLFLFFK